MNETARVVHRAGELPAIDGVRLGEKVRALRTSRRLTLNELALKAGVSVGIISQIERGRSNPSMSTLNSIRAALGVTLWALLDPGTSGQAQDAVFVRRAAGRPAIEVGHGRIRKELLSINPDSDLRFMTISMPSGSETQDVLIGTGEKAGVILEGEVELTVGGRTAILYKGDSFQFDSDQVHRVANRSAAPAELIWIMSTATAAL
jgi:transcriptional regulator with XRE-family HTH domain